MHSFRLFFSIYIKQQRAIKRLKGIFSWDRLVRLREVQCLLKLAPHPNIVRLFDVIRHVNDIGCFVFEYMPDGNLLEFMDRRRKYQLGPPPDTEIRIMLQQILRGLHYMHQKGVWHRDIKPENILLDGRICKVADFSLARCLDEATVAPLSEYISTRWYRAPEVALGCHQYGLPIDLFAVGCVTAELYTLKTLLPGNEGIDHLVKMFAFLGTPQAAGWKEGAHRLIDLPINLSPSSAAANPYQSLRQLLPPPRHQDTAALDFVARLLALDPAQRLTAAQALSHSYFLGVDSGRMVNAPTNSKVTTAMTTTTTLDSSGFSNSSDSSSSSNGSSCCTTPSAGAGVFLPNGVGGTNQQQHSHIMMVTVSPAPPKGPRSQQQLPAAVQVFSSPPPLVKEHTNNNNAKPSIQNPYLSAKRREATFSS